MGAKNGQAPVPRPKALKQPMGAIIGKLRFDRLVSPLDETGLGASDARNIRAVADSQLINAGELRDTLERGGHRFPMRTDAELIAHAYDRWGTLAFARLRGPFACAIWDDANRRLILARDHVGVRRLYFAVLPGHSVVFASDVCALLRDPDVPRDWCPYGIDAYLALGFIPAPLTAFRQISKLQPAHYLLVDGQRLHLEQYWDFSTPRIATRCGSVTAIAASLRTAVRHELKHQPRAALLYSGGTASSALLSVTPATFGVPITVHTDQDPAELTRSYAAASMLGRARELETLEQPVSSLVEAVAAASGEPIADPSAVIQLAICTAAARHTDIALTGHGAAILWSGYDRRALPSRFALRIGNDYAAMRESTVWEDRRRRSIYTRAFAWKVRDTNPFSSHLERWQSQVDDAPADRMRYVNARTALPDNVLAFAANASQAAGISLRFPFLDDQMTELAMQTPAEVRRRGPFAMSIIRQLFAPRLPRRLRPPARQPVRHDWLAPLLTALVPRMLLAPRFDGRDIVSRPALRRVWNEHLAARLDHSRRLWSLLMLEFWFREFIDGDAAGEPLEYAVLRKTA
jgi:asparagine synthase (glutamine-hydrolysing)